MSDIVERLRASVTQCRAVDRSALLAEAAAEIERLRLTEEERAVCPYVTGTVTRYCTLTPFTLTDEEREAVGMAERWARLAGPCDIAHTLRGLLERLV